MGYTLLKTKGWGIDMSAMSTFIRHIEVTLAGC